MQDYKRLEVWRRAHRVVVEIYGATKKFPNEERFGLTSQIRRAAVSIPANIAEGSRRSFDREFSQYVNIAQGSRSEVQYLLQLSSELGYVTLEVATQLDADSRGNRANASSTQGEHFPHRVHLARSMSHVRAP